MIRTLIALPFRLAALVVAIPTRLSARLLRFSVVAAARATRLAVRSSLVSFAAGVGLGWFLSTPTGRYTTGAVLDAVRGGRGTPPETEPSDPPAAPATATDAAAVPSHEPVSNDAATEVPEPAAAGSEGSV